MKRVLIYLLRYRQTHYKFQINQSPSYHPQKLYSRPVSPAKEKAAHLGDQFLKNPNLFVIYC